MCLLLARLDLIGVCSSRLYRQNRATELVKISWSPYAPSILVFSSNWQRSGQQFVNKRVGRDAQRMGFE